MEAKDRYRLNINGYKDKSLHRANVANQISLERGKLLKSLSVEQLLQEVGYYGEEKYT